MALAVCPCTQPGKVCATGDKTGPRPAIILWDVGTTQVLSKLSGFHHRAVTALDFSPTGRQLVSIGSDRWHSVAVYDWQLRRLLFTCRTKEEQILGVKFRSEEEFVS